MKMNAGESEGFFSLTKEKQYLFWLCQIPSLGATGIRKLGETFGSFEQIYEYALYNIEERETPAKGILRKGQWQAICEAVPHFEQCEADFERLRERKIGFITPLDEEYPGLLREIPDYPMGLYMRGRIPDPDKPGVAIVGARGCSAYGERIAEEFARMLSDEGVQIISGLAAGIDGAAHRGALKGKTATFGILGCGVNICYPSSNYHLYEEMLQRGGIISEFPLDARPSASHFPMRNRIISGMVDAVLVVEAREKSGSLITAELGLEQGKEIFAIPGRLTDRLSSGCNKLIQQGAGMAISPGDILEYLGLKCKKELILHENHVNGLEKKEKMLYSCLDFKPKHLDKILSESGLSLAECLSILMELELGGYVFRSGNHYYGKRL